MFPEPAARVARKAAGRRGANISTSSEPDSEFPVIVSPPAVVARTTGTLVVSWETDEPANSVLRYGAAGAKVGRTAGLGNTVVSEEFVSAHTIEITGLSPNTSYRFQAASTDASGNGEALSSELSTTTLQSEDFSPPHFLELPSAETSSDTRVSVRFVTDEPSDARVKYRPVGSGALFDERYLPELETERLVTLTNLAASTTYDIVVEARDVLGNGPASASVEATTTDGPDVSPPKIVAGPSVRVEDTRATITWETDEPADSRVEFGLTAELGGFSAQSELVTEHSIVVTGLENTTHYYFAVFAADASGNEADSTGAALGFTTLSTADTEPPAKVAGVTAAAGASEAMLSWAVNTEADLAGYRIERASGGGAFEVIAEGLTKTTYRDVDLTAGTAYQYRVIAVDASANRNAGLPSDAVEVTPSLDNVPGAPGIMAQPEPAPAEPLLVVTNAAVNASSIAGYTFVVAGDDALREVVVTGSEVPEGEERTSWTVPFPLEHGQTYWWAARVVDDAGFSGPLSEISSFVADTTVVVSVELISFEALAANGVVRLSWQITGENSARWHVWRSVEDSEYERLTTAALATGTSGRYLDAAPTAGRTLSYMLELVEGASSRFLGPVTAHAFLPADLVFQRNVPNPFNPTTMLRFGLPVAGHVTLSVYNTLGQRVAVLADRPMAAGFHTVRWDGTIDGGRMAGSGVYLLRLVHRPAGAPEQVRLQRVLLAK